MDTKHKVLWAVIGVLAVAVVVLLTLLLGGHTGPAAGVAGQVVPISSSDNQLTILSPTPGSAVGNPFAVTGVANGPWVTNGFTVQLFTADGSMVGSNKWDNQGGFASGTAQFTVNIFHAPSKSVQSGNLMILMNGSASGTAPRAVTIPVKF